MNQPARKPGDPGGKLKETLSVDDPSIPVLTERLTLPPLDLNLDFRLPARPAPVEEDPAEPLDEDETRIAPLVRDDPIVPADSSASAEALALESLEGFETLAPMTGFEPEPPPPADEPLADERAALLAGPATPGVPIVPMTPVEPVAPVAPVEPPEATDISPRVPTSLLLSNIDALLATPPSATPYRDPGDFDLTQTDGQRPNRMETDLREMILLDLARRLPTEVEAIVRRHLEGAIEEAIRRFAAEVRIALAGSLREIVDRAVKSELDRLNGPRR